MKYKIKNILRRNIKYEYIVYIVKKFLMLIVSDENYFKYYYYKTFNRKLNINDLKTLNEKVIGRILFDKNILYSNLTDKVDVRKYVKEKIGEKYLIKLYGVYENVNEIDMNVLPKEFVLKCNHDSGSVFICEDKNTFNISYAKKKLRFYLKRNYYYLTREWHYKNINPRIICEEKLVDTTDYKFHCFHGKVEQIKVISGRFSDKRMNEYDRYWNLKDVEVGNCKQTDVELEKPKNFEKMIEIAERLSADFEYVRVDLYNVNGEIKFGELTFTPASGFSRMPYDMDLALGKLW